MKQKVWFSIGGGVVVVVILFILLSRVFTPGSSAASELTEQEAKAVAQQRYSGLIQEIKQEADDYVIQLERETGLYELQINAKTGEISSLKRIEVRENKAANQEQPVRDNQPGTTEEPQPGTIEKPQPGTTEKSQPENNKDKKAQTILTEAEATAIALEQVPGTVDDVDVENINGVVHFLVEVEGNDGREATVEINSVTREVESFTWDDDDDDD